ncbi:sulfatase-like hydrolase/transferase, partial [Candidatus Sumerlaeota bacterium]|nr:sulfatase-like hydrolase/transferase [Candidatus Sumerlaeota bacterium]
MNFGFTEEQEMMRKSAADFVKGQSSLQRVRGLFDDDKGYSPEVWKQMADQGWLGAVYPEECGGLGMGYVDLICIEEQLGEGLLPEPIISSVLLGGNSILFGCNSEQKDAIRQHGFDEYCLFPEGKKGHPAHKKRYWDPYVIRNGQRLDTTGQFGPDIFTDYLIDYMSRHRERPFFAYYSTIMTHIPVVPTPFNKDQDLTPRERFAGMLRYADHLIGRLVAALDEFGLRDHTIVFIAVDNGTDNGTD